MKLELSYEEIKELREFLDEYSDALKTAAKVILEREDICKECEKDANRMLKKAESLTNLKHKILYQQMTKKKC